MRRSMTMALRSKTRSRFSLTSSMICLTTSGASALMRSMNRLRMLSGVISHKPRLVVVHHLVGDGLDVVEGAGRSISGRPVRVEAPEESLSWRFSRA